MTDSTASASSNATATPMPPPEPTTRATPTQEPQPAATVTATRAPPNTQTDTTTTTTLAPATEVAPTNAAAATAATRAPPVTQMDAAASTALAPATEVAPSNAAVATVATRAPPATQTEAATTKRKSAAKKERDKKKLKEKRKERKKRKKNIVELQEEAASEPSAAVSSSAATSSRSGGTPATTSTSSPSITPSTSSTTSSTTATTTPPSSSCYTDDSQIQSSPSTTTPVSPTTASVSMTGTTVTSDSSLRAPSTTTPGPSDLLPTIPRHQPVSNQPTGKQPRPMGKQPRHAPILAVDGEQDGGSDSYGEQDEDSDESDESDETKSVNGGGKGDGGQVRTQLGFQKKPPRKRLIVPGAAPKNFDKIDRIVDYRRGASGKITHVMVVYQEKTKRDEWIDADRMTDISIYSHDIATIEMWKKSKSPTLRDFFRTSVGKKRINQLRALGADDDTMACGYDAIAIALDLLSLPNAVNAAMIAEFKAVGAKRRKISANEFEKQGVMWGALRAFINKLGVVNMSALDRNLFTGSGVGVDALSNLRLADGVYLVGGRSTENIGHCFVAEITCNGDGVWIHDKDNLEDVEWLRRWLATVSYVRHVVPAKKEEGKT